MANSLMFQRFPTHDGYEDPQLSNFYGQALPFLKRGVPVKTVHLENVSYKETLKETKVLLMTYSNMKPMSADGHRHLAQWVKKGGILVYSGRDEDPYQTVSEWWNTNGNTYQRPSDHLFEQLGIPAGADAGEYAHGKGVVYILRNDPKEYVLKQEGDAEFIQVVKDLYERKSSDPLIFKNQLYLERGPYDIIAVLDENENAAAFTVNGPVIDLYDPELPVLAQKIIQPGQQALLYNLGRVPVPSKPQVLASASRIYDEEIAPNSYAFVCRSPLHTTNVMRVLLPAEPQQFTVTDPEGRAAGDVKTSWDASSRTYFLQFENHPDGMHVTLGW